MMNATPHGRYPLIGEVYGVKFEGEGSVQKKYRPALIFQNNVGNRHSPNVVVLPFTSVRKKVNQPTHVLVDAAGSGLKTDSMLLCENPQSISKDMLGEYITTLPDKYMREVAIASLLANSAISYLNISMIAPLVEKAAKLNAV